MKMLNTVNQIPWIVILFLCFTIGLAPYSPPHVIEKLMLLSQNNLVRPIDWFDLFFHGLPWFILILRGIAFIRIKDDQ